MEKSETKHTVSQEKLVDEALKTAGKFYLDDSKRNAAGCVGAALITRSGKLYTGICVEMVCAMGFCAETAAVAEMLKDRETEVAMIVAVKHNGNIIPPCGKCREMLFQVDRRNLETEVIIGKNETKRLKELLTDLWVDKV